MNRLKINGLDDWLNFGDLVEDLTGFVFGTFNEEPKLKKFAYSMVNDPAFQYKDDYNPTGDYEVQGQYDGQKIGEGTGWIWISPFGTPYVGIRIDKDMLVKDGWETLKAGEEHYFRTNDIVFEPTQTTDKESYPLEYGDKHKDIKFLKNEFENKGHVKWKSEVNPYFNNNLKQLLLEDKLPLYFKDSKELFNAATKITDKKKKKGINPLFIIGGLIGVTLLATSKGKKRRK